MTAFANLPVSDQDTLGTVRDLLARLLREGVVQAVLVPVTTYSGRSVQPALVSDPERLRSANPVMPVLPISGARMAALVTEREEGSQGRPQELPRIAAVFRPCEFRAAVELGKLKQLNLGQLLSVVIDCVGTHEMVDLRDGALDVDECVQSVLGAAQQASPDAPGELGYRHACTICDTPVVGNADLCLHTIGIDTKTQILVEAADGALLEKLGLTAGAEAGEHAAAVEALTATRRERREADLDAFMQTLEAQGDGRPGLIATFDTCLRCHNCTVACPICYCKNCLFRTDTMEYEPGRYMGWVKKKGAARLPGDTVTFQLTRLNHMANACIGCGLCTSACPADLPLDTVFQAIGRRTQAMLGYVPGRDISEPIPMATFKKDEFVGFGETEH